jgi:hypothetical protein
MLVCASLVVLPACGAPDGPLPDVAYFWKLGSFTLEFGQCSDEPAFRAAVSADAEKTENLYLIYRVASDGQTAVQLDCTALDPSSCVPSASNTVWAVSGRELSVTRERKDPIGTTGCAQAQTLTWTLTDRGHTLDVEGSDVITLVDAPTACEAIDTNQKARSPNMLGFAGCVITKRFSGERTLPR